MLEKEHQRNINTTPVRRKNSNWLIGAGIAGILALSAGAYGFMSGNKQNLKLLIGKMSKIKH
jgi:hypothetical protein